MTTTCRQCNGDTTRDGVTEFYELRHHYRPESGDAIDIGAGRKMRLPDFDLTDDQTSVFCSPRCLTAYVMARIAPDARGE